MTVIYRGTLTKEKLKELAKIHLGFGDNDAQFNPSKNPKAISVIQQEDGNYIGSMWKIDHFVEVRQGDPNTVLSLLITHE